MNESQTVVILHIATEGESISLFVLMHNAFSHVPSSSLITNNTGGPVRNLVPLSRIGRFKETHRPAES